MPLDIWLYCECSPGIDRSEETIKNCDTTTERATLGCRISRDLHFTSLVIVKLYLFFVFRIWWHFQIVHCTIMPIISSLFICLWLFERRKKECIFLGLFFRDAKSLERTRGHIEAYFRHSNLIQTIRERWRRMTGVEISLLVWRLKSSTLTRWR